ncbi:sugar ABC transporter substrate-binding protein [Amycolatopsis sp. NPDC049252]|uniref:sugar ABC transporter substrate-binding protein n=1 Tax=Amycolatopsis sp. NPDC049252 TaxID=3363933 RepID=UPI0037141E43
MKSQLRSLRVRNAVAIPLALGIALVATGCSSAGTGSGGQSSTVLRGVVANTSDPFWNTMACGATAAAKKRGVDLKWYGSKSTDPTELNTNFNAALLDQPQGVILDSPTVDQFSAQVAGQQAKGVPFTMAVPMNPPSYNTVIGNQDAPPEMIAMGADVLKGGGSVFTVGGSAAVPLVADRYRLLLQELGKGSGVTILPVQFTDFDPTKTQVAVNSAILAHPDLKLLVASTGPETSGVLAALQQAGRTDIKVISFDAVPAAVEALRAGKILAIGSLPAAEVGEIQVNALADYVDQHKGSVQSITEAKQSHIKTGLLTRQNIDDPASARLIYKATCDE